MTDESNSRRPVYARNTTWAAVLARKAAGFGLRPNQISMLSVVFSGLCAGSIYFGSVTDAQLTRTVLYITAAACIGLRGLCNLLDGMVAIEGGMKSKSGEIFNDLPDRISDCLMLVAAGYAIGFSEWGVPVGWLTAVLAVMTAYTRQLGAAAGAGHDFRGPMAKIHRMAVLASACILAAFEHYADLNGHVLLGALVIICTGCLITIVRRVVGIIRKLEAS